jgi:O-acetylserine/cysteine efflux transporter
VIFATLLGLFIFKEKIGWKTWSGIALAIAGIAVMLGAPDIMQHPVGSLAVLASSFAAALSYIRMKQLKAVHAATYMGLTTFIAVPFLMLGSFLFEPQSWANLPDANWSILGPIFFCQATVLSITHIWWQRMIHQHDISKVSAFTLLVPVFTVVLSVSLLDEALTWPVMIGGLMTVGGVAVIMLRRIQKGVIKTAIEDNPA